MTALKRTAMFLLLLLLLLLAVLLYVTLTHGGMQRLFSLGQSYVAGELTIGETSGSLAGPATASDILFVNENGASVNIDSARVDWQPRKLWRRTVQVDELDLQGVTVYLPQPSENSGPNEPFQLRDLALPVKADIKSLRIADLKVYPHGESDPLVIDKITMSATGRESSLKLVELQVVSPIFNFSMDGTLDTSGEWPADLNQVWQLNHPQFGTFNGQGSISGSSSQLIVSHEITGPAAVSVKAQIKDVTTELSWDGLVVVTVDNLGVFSADAEGLPLKLDATTAGSLDAYSLQGNLESLHPLTGSTLMNFMVTGDLTKMAIAEATISLEDSPSNATISGEILLEDLHSDITVDWSEMRWPLLSMNPAIASPTGQISITGPPNNLAIVGTTALDRKDTGLLDVRVDLLRTDEVLAINTLNVSPQGSNGRVVIAGEIDLKQQAIDVKGDISKMTWPFDATTATVSIPNGEFTLDGLLSEYLLSADVSVQGKHVPAGRWTLSGKGNQDFVEHLQLNGRTLDGNVIGAATVGWQPEVSWQADLMGRGLNPAEKWPQLNGDINFEITSSGSVTDQGINANNKISKISGSYRGQRLDGNGVVEIKDSDIRVDQLRINAGDAVLSASGFISDTADLSFQLDAAALDKLIPGVSGALNIQGALTGDMASPATDITITADNLVASGLEVKKVRGEGRIDLGGSALSKVELQMESVVAAGEVFDQVVINGSGTPERHTATAIAKSDVANLNLSAAGAFNNGLWRGVVEQLDITDTEVGDWLLESPAEINAGANSTSATPMCLTSDPSKLCLDANWNNRSGLAAKLDINALNTVRFQRYLPPDFTIDSLANGSAEIKLAPGGAPSVTADISVPGGKLTYLDAGELKTTDIGANRISFDFANDNLSSNVDLDLGEIGTIEAITNIGALSAEKNLSGSVVTDLKDISLFSSFAPGLDSFDGSLDTEFQLAGTVDAPKVIGDTDLDALVLEVPSVALKLIDGKIVARSDGKGGLLLSGQAQSGDGKIDLDGTFDPATQDFAVTIRGENFRVANAKNQRAVVSPDLKVTRVGDYITVTGDVHIPSAFVNAGAVSGLVRESTDVVLLEGGVEVKEQQAANQIELDVRVTLGDDVRVKAGQFNGALAGELSVAQLPGGVPAGVGTIEVVNGDFLVYGQKLTMEKGRILFGGGPVTNPALELDVAREVAAYNVKAGARIRGTAQAPLLQLQSDPPQTDANTLSYILLGEPVGTAGASYTLGKYITPDIYVSYGIDLFDSKNRTYNVRYRINDLLYLLASKSKVSGADLIYTFER